MKTIGFIDYYLDEWHANNYPKLIKEVSDGELEVTCAYAVKDSPLEGGMTTDEWCEKYKIKRCYTIEEVIEKCDCLLVLSPDNCEMHEELCRLPLSSGKLTYVDKTFAPDKETAERIFEVAEEHSTPCYSTSALRFAAEYKNIESDNITVINSWGPNDFDTYSIHQLEPIMMLMKSKPVRVMWLEAEKWVELIIAFEDGAVATVSCFSGGSPFMMNISGRGETRIVQVESDYFSEFIKELCNFYITGKPVVPHDETVAIMAVRGAGLKAQKTPGEWVEI